MTKSIPERLLKAVLAEPAKDAPREIMADWLEEQGTEPAIDRANLIRVMCKLARSEKVPVPCKRCHGRGLYSQTNDPVSRKGSQVHAKTRRVVTYRAMPTEDVLCEKCNANGFTMRDSPLKFAMAEIFRKWGRAWDQELIDKAVGKSTVQYAAPTLRWERGFAECLCCYWHDFDDYYRRLRTETPIREVLLHNGSFLNEPFRSVQVIDPPGVYYKHDRYPGLRFYGVTMAFEIQSRFFTMTTGDA